ncbi:MAG TPA: MMPL family transporter [Polyangia bacterium]|jgi:predicted RND superfamily exporter protein|nr:MMPL family transporter [Polyangia bacterium]
MTAGRAPSRPARARAVVPIIPILLPIMLGLAVLSALPAACRMARLYQNLRPELDELLPPDSPAVRGAHTLRARAAGSQYLGVVIRGATAGPPATMAAQLGARMSAFAAARPDLIAAVKTDIVAERAFLGRRGALYLPLDDLRTIADRLSARVSWEKARANPLFVSLDDEGGPPSVDLSDVEARARAADPFAGRFADDRLVSADGRTAIVLIFMATAEAGAGALAPIVARARSEVAALRDAPGAGALEVGYAGDVAIAVEELSALESDVAVSAVLVLVGVVLSILLVFRAPRTLPALALPVAIGTVWGFGVASLFVSSLGSSTAFLGSIVIGNGINPGIILVARYLEERRRGAPTVEATAIATRTTWRGTLAAAVAAAAGYASLATTSFRGFNEFGVIASAGAITCWVATYLFLPRLLRLVDRRHDRAASTPATVGTSPGGRFATALVTGRAGRVVAVSLALIGVGALLATRLDSRRIEYDMSKLRNRESRRTGEGYWGVQMDALLGRNFTAVAFMTEAPNQARTVAAALAEAVKKDPLASVSSRLVTPDDLIPPDDAAKRSELARIARLLTPAVRTALSDDDRASLDKLLGAAGDGPITPAELPILLARGMREKDGRFGRTLLMLQSLDNATWDGAVTIRAAKAVDAVANVVTPPAAVAGGFVVSANILETLEREALPTTAAAFGAVALVVLVLFRGRRETLWTLGALLGGATLLAGAVVALDIRINFLSFIAFPITFGIGVEYALNVLYRHRQDPDPAALAAVVSGTGRAVALCSLTTIIGYGSLLLARNQALFSFGMLAVLGEICCLAVAVVALPAALAVARRRTGRPVAPGQSSPYSPSL